MWTLCILLLTCVLIGTVRSEYKFDTKWFQVPLDHFAYQNNETFKIKYLVNDSYWDNDRGPIFFYTGNEGQIELFAQHTGFMWDIAPQFKAKIVFAEHRYYGASMPFGNKSLDNEYIGYLTSAQALADYADLVDSLQHKTNKVPVIAFGGSYGGMLAAYFRMKYPHLVAGAIAASAPVHMFPDMAPCDGFARIVTSSFAFYGKNKCSDNIKKSWAILRNFTSNANNTAWLEKNWKLCDPVKNSTDVDILLGFLRSMYETLAMVNYPFASDFLMPLPADPVRVVCQYLNTELSGQKLIEAIGNVLQLYVNYSGKVKCVDYKKGEDYGNLDASGWNYQACTEMIMPMCTTGEDDMFERDPWNYTTFSEACHRRYGVYPRPNTARLEYGGNRIQAASNIVFSNGLLDPWTAGGILSSINPTIQALLIPNAAHHLDLMPATNSDPSSVVAARATHAKFIQEWIHRFHNQ